jgi:MFS family permease
LEKTYCKTRRGGAALFYMSGTNVPVAAEAWQKKAMSTAIKAPSLYAVADLLYLNSFMLMYLAAMGLPGDMILVWLAVPNLVFMAVMIPSAHHAGRRPYIKTGFIGHMISAAGMVMLICAPFLRPFGQEWILLLLGMTAHGAGSAVYAAIWFPLTGIFVPESGRGRFFGTMRFSYQIVSIIFALVVIAALRENSDIRIFQFFLCAALLCKVAGAAFLLKLPVNKISYDPSVTVRDSLFRAAAAPGYMPFCAYTFLLTLATGCCASLFGLLAKGPLGFGDDEVILTGNLLMLGSLGGFYLGGRLVDRLGTKLMFLICHFSYGAVLLAFLARGLIPAGGALFFIGGLGALFGLVQAVSGIALTTEMMTLAPADNKPVATSLNQALMVLGTALSGILSSQAIKFGILSREWTLAGHAMSQYDTLILFCAVTVIILVVTLGLVPSVLKGFHSSEGGPGAL